jgi:two-component system, sensor histidine kinase and response regulator
MTLVDNSCLCIALFSPDKELQSANSAMQAFFKDDVPWRNIQNPDLERLASMHSEKNLIYSGFVTIGSNTTINTSISDNVFRKNGSILIIGGVNANQMADHNLKLHDMNREISDLQRQLMKEKVTL